MYDWGEGIPHPVLSAESLFKHAESFQRSFVLLNDAVDEASVADIAYPAVHLASVAVELYLKCLVFSYKGAMVGGHDLLKLFRELPAGQRTALEKLWTAYLPTSSYASMKAEDLDRIGWPPSLERALTLGSNTQKQTRYAWEIFPSSTFMLGDLPELLRQYILRANPTWKRRPPQPSVTARLLPLWTVRVQN